LSNDGDGVNRITQMSQRYVSCYRAGGSLLQIAIFLLSLKPQQL